MMKRQIFCLCAVIFCLISIPAMASLNLASMPAHNLTWIQQLANQDFIVKYGSGLGTAQAKVTSTVYEADAGGYIYAYQIFGATTKFTWFSVAFHSIPITKYGVEVSGTEVAPIAWDVVVDDDLAPASTNMEALFSPGLMASSNSAILWFVCADDTPGTGIGALAKLSVGGGTYAEGAVLVPFPEPMTMVLLGSGLVMLRFCRHKN
jgi:hypothetical protein